MRGGDAIPPAPIITVVGEILTPDDMLLCVVNVSVSVLAPPSPVKIVLSPD